MQTPPGFFAQKSYNVIRNTFCNSDNVFLHFGQINCGNKTNTFCSLYKCADQQRSADSAGGFHTKVLQVKYILQFCQMYLPTWTKKMWKNTFSSSYKYADQLQSADAALGGLAQKSYNVITLALINFQSLFLISLSLLLFLYLPFLHRSPTSHNSGPHKLVSTRNPFTFICIALKS